MAWNPDFMRVAEWISVILSYDIEIRLTHDNTEFQALT